MQLLLALDLMNQKYIIHRDIKPDNILILDKATLNICIADLGLACYQSDKSSIFSKCGSPCYVDPEVLRNKGFSDKSDIFSLGSLLYNLVTGRLLFEGTTI